MRNSFMLALFVVLVSGCGKQPAQNGPDGGGGGGGGGGGMDASGSGSNGTPAFEVQSPPVMLAPGQEVTYCYYFHTPNTAQLTINKWVSSMTPGSHHMIMFFNTGSGSQPADGTINTNDCGLGTGGTSNVPVWVYASQTPEAELDLPSDDGAGKPLGMVVPPNQAAYFQMHYLNATDGPLMAHVDLKAYALPDGAPFTQTAAWITYNSQISIPPHATNHVESMTCSTPSNVQFWLLSSHSHKQSIGTDTKDGTNMVVSSTDWEHPTVQIWQQAPFYTFASGKLTYECTYNNIGQTALPDNENNTIVAGPSAQTNEMCMSTGYFFPATGPEGCLNSAGPFPF